MNYTSGTIAVRGNFANGIYAAGDLLPSPPRQVPISLSSANRRTFEAGDRPRCVRDCGGQSGAKGDGGVNNPDDRSRGPIPMFAKRFRHSGVQLRRRANLRIITGHGSITTEGGNGIGIAAASGGGSIAVNSSGPITTTGSGAIGILAEAPYSPTQSHHNLVGSSISTLGPEAMASGPLRRPARCRSMRPM